MIIKKSSSLRPLIPWVGGKYKLANNIIDLMNIPVSCNTLISPTCGGLGFETKFHQRYPNIKIISSDSNRWLINLYNSIKNQPSLFLTKILKYDQEWQNLNSKEKRKEWYYSLRKIFNSDKLSIFDQSVLFLVLVKTGYNGLMQINNQGKLTTAFGFGVVKKLIDVQNYKSFVKFTKHCIFLHRDYIDSLKDVTNKSVVYIDPLYKDSKQMYSSDIEMANIKKLKSFLENSRKKGSLVSAMSNSYDPKFWKKVFPTAEIYEIERNQGIHRDVVEKGRPKVKENLIIYRK